MAAKSDPSSSSLQVTSKVRLEGYFWAEDAIFDLALSAWAKLTYLYLKRRADSEGLSWPSLPSIAKAVSCSIRQVSRAIEELIVAKLLERESGQLRAESNRYTVKSVRAEWVGEVAEARLPVQPKGQPVREAGLPVQQVSHTVQPSMPTSPARLDYQSNEGIHTEGMPKEGIHRKDVEPCTEAAPSVPMVEPAGPKTMDVWTAYREAYEHRYDSRPVRNARVNGQLVNLIKRLGAAEAPAVARHYVGSNATLYVRSGHAIDLLLRDAEKLRTEWATGRRIMERDARNGDERQSRANMWNGLMAEARAKDEAAMAGEMTFTTSAKGH